MNDNQKLSFITTPASRMTTQDITSARAPRALTPNDLDKTERREELLCNLIDFLLSLHEAYRDEQQPTTPAAARPSAREDAS